VSKVFTVKNVLDGASKLIDLWERSVIRDPFNHPVMWQALLESRIHRGKLLFCCLEDANLLIACWPLVVRGSTLKDPIPGVVESLGANYIDYPLPLARSEEDLVRLLFCIKERMCGRNLRLPRVVAGSVLDRAVQKVFLEERNAAATVLPVKDALLEWQGREADEVERSWSRNHRSNLRKRLNKIRGHGGFHYKRLARREEIITALESLFLLHQKEWRWSQFKNAADRSFFKHLAERMPLDLLHVSEGRIGDRLASLHFGFRGEDWIYWFKPAYDPDLSGFSPGMLHIYHMFREESQAGLSGIDFLPGDERYKFVWGTRERLDRTLCIRGNLVGSVWMLWESSAREKVKNFYYETRKYLGV